MQSEKGGVIGPNLVSIGASASADYLIESLLEPSKKIRKGTIQTWLLLRTEIRMQGAFLVKRIAK